MFDPAALFLLDLGWFNLFEEADASEWEAWTYRCKGCRQTVARPEREKHYRHHKRVEHARRERETKRNRERALALARKARRHQTEGRTP
jgi:hypothetical protein